MQKITNRAITFSCHYIAQKIKGITPSQIQGYLGNISDCESVSPALVQIKVSTVAMDRKMEQKSVIDSQAVLSLVCVSHLWLLCLLATGALSLRCFFQYGENRPAF